MKQVGYGCVLASLICFGLVWQSKTISITIEYAALPELGGDTTTKHKSRQAFGQPVRNMPFERRTTFEVGDSLFNQNWVTAGASTTARDGLGPLFNARSCSGCHSRDGRGRPPLTAGEATLSLLFRLSVGDNGGPQPHTVYGGQLQPNAIEGAMPEGAVDIRHETIHGHFADGTPYELQRPIYSFRDANYGIIPNDILVSPRTAPHMIGLGLLESIAEADIIANADPDDLDGNGISGRANRVWDAVNQQQALGRFGWKANQPSLHQQVAGAFNGDMGLTTSLFPNENNTAEQKELIDFISGGQPEVPDHQLEAVVFYSSHLAVPRQRNADDPQVQRGRQVFQRIGCTDCHIETFTTADATVALSPMLANQTIHPYSDLLLHDMGPGLADNRPDFKATGSEWRTPPLWGIGLFPVVNGHSRYLHDGRARNMTEAILWHGGEASAAQQLFVALPVEQRNDLIAFLESL